MFVRWWSLSADLWLKANHRNRNAQRTRTTYHTSSHHQATFSRMGLQQVAVAEMCFFFMQLEMHYFYHGKQKKTNLSSTASSSSIASLSCCKSIEKSIAKCFLYTHKWEEAMAVIRTKLELIEKMCSKDYAHWRVDFVEQVFRVYDCPRRMSFHCKAPKFNCLRHLKELLCLRCPFFW